MIKKILIISSIVFFSLSLYAKNDYECYNIKRAQELIQEQKYADAAEYLDKEINDNPTNGFAWMNYALAYAASDMSDEALSCINKAIPLLQNEYTNEYMSYVISIKAGIYYQMKDWSKTIDTYTQAIKLDKKSEKAYYWRAKTYYNKEDWSNCISDCQQIIHLSGEYRLSAYSLMGDTYFAQKKYSHAVGYYDKVIDGTTEPSLLAPALTSRSACNWELGNKRSAIDDVLLAIENNSNLGYYYLQYFAKDENFFPLIRTKLQAKIVKTDNSAYWQVALGDCFSRRNEPIEAIKNYVAASNEVESANKDLINNRIYSVLKRYCIFDEIDYFYQHKLETSDNQIDDKIDYAYHVLDPSGKPDEAIRLLDDCLTEDPDNTMAYYVRARIKRYKNLLKEAIDDYTMAIMLQEEYTFSYNERADCYKLLGQTNKANDDYRLVLAIDGDEETGSEISNSVYSLFYLGRINETKKLLTKAQAQDGFSDYYDAACLWSLLGDKAKSISALREAFENGYRDFNHIIRDTDLNNIRNSIEFKSLVNNFKNIHQNEQNEIHNLLLAYHRDEGSLTHNSQSGPSNKIIDNHRLSASQSHAANEAVSIPFTVEGNLTKVKCKVNDLPLSFIFDTGASKVTISSIEATFMYKNGYLTRNDFGSSEYFSTASGEVVEGTIVTLKNVEIGGIKLSNVKATVVHNQNAPLLLGQSVLSRLGKIEIDNVNKLLIIQPK